MRNDLQMYHAVTEARRLYEAGLSIQAAAADAAEKYGLHPLHVGEAVGRAIHDCRKVRERRPDGGNRNGGIDPDPLS